MLRTLRIFISSPGDVAEERVIARRVIGRLDAQIGDLVHLEAVTWEQAPLVTTASFQEQLMRPSDADIAIVVLWSRLGTALPASLHRADGSTYASGTEFEFEDALEGFRRCGRPNLLTYRKTAPTPVPAGLEAQAEDVRQKQAMERFVARWFTNEADGSLKAAFHNFASAADFEDLFEAHLARLIEPHLPRERAAHGAAPTWRGASPFRGLEVFEPEHAAVFFGRTAATTQVLAKLRSQGQARKAFVLLVAMSGGGKSSLVRAGVLPLVLQPGVLGTATVWRHVVVRPSEGNGDPLHALQRAVRLGLGFGDAEAAGDPGPFVASTMARLAAIAVAAGGGACHLLLVVDQLEEIFSDERIDVATRTAFFETVDALARCGVVWIVATLRSDAYPRIVEQPLLVALKEGDGQFDLLPPTVREIGQIIRFPAAAAGLRFEARNTTAERLDDVIRDAAARNPGALPLLQFLLEELYERRNAEDVLTFRAYDELGGVEGALAQRAEAVLASVGPAAQATLPLVLRELVTFGADDDSKPLRRVAPRSAFASKESIELVEALLAARLLVGTLDANGEPAISLAHEALLEFWPRLRAWRDDDRELLLIHARLANASRAWERDARSADLLLSRGKPLAEAKGLIDAGVRLTPAETALVVASDRRARRFALLRAGAIGGLAVLAAVAGFAAWRANLESSRAQVQATTAQRTTDFMVSLFKVADPEQNQGATITVQEILDRGTQQLQSELTTEGGVRTNLLRAIGQSYNGLGLYPRAREVLSAALAEAERGGTAQDQLRARLALAENRYQDGDFDRAEALLRQALAQATLLFGDRDANVARTMTSLAETLAENGKSAEAEGLLRRALDAHEKAHPGNQADTALTLDALGRLLFFDGRYLEAEAALQKALAMQRSLFGATHTSSVSTLSNLGTLYAQTGRFEEATRAYSEALPIYRKVYGNAHQLVAANLNNLGRVELLTGRLRSARGHLTEALAIDRVALDKEHGDFIPLLNSLAMVELADGNQAEAGRLLAEALRIARAKNHWMLNQVLGNEAEWLLAGTRTEEAGARVGEARVVLRKQYGEKLDGAEAWRSGVLDLTEAAYELEVGRPEQAEALIRRAQPALRKQFGDRGLYPDRAARRLVAAQGALPGSEKAR